MYFSLAFSCFALILEAIVISYIYVFIQDDEYCICGAGGGRGEEDRSRRIGERALCPALQSLGPPPPPFPSVKAKPLPQFTGCPHPQ